MTSLNLPETGRGSLANLSRRTGALCLDWAAAMLIAGAFVRGNVWATLAIFAVWTLVGVATVGGSIGHFVFRMQVRRLEAATEQDWSVRGLPGPTRALARTLLVCLVIPPVVWDADGRGLHDRLCGTVLVLR